MKLEIKEAIDKGETISLKLEYDWEFAAAIAKIAGVSYPSEEEIEDFVTMVLENMDEKDLRELGNQINE